MAWKPWLAGLIVGSILVGVISVIPLFSSETGITGNLVVDGSYNFSDRDFKEEYLSVNWSESSDSRKFAGSVYDESLGNLSQVNASLDNRTVKINSSEALNFVNLFNSSANLSFDTNILGIPSDNLTLGGNSSVLLRIEDNLTVGIAYSNTSIEKRVVKEPEAVDVNESFEDNTSDSKVNSSEEEFNSSEEFNGSENYTEDNRTMDGLEVVTDVTGGEVYNFSEDVSVANTTFFAIENIDNLTKEVEVSSNLTLDNGSRMVYFEPNTTKGIRFYSNRSISLKSFNDTFYRVEKGLMYMLEENSSEANISVNESDGEHNEENLSENFSSEDDETDNVTNSTEEAIGSNKTLNNVSYPSKGGEWVKIDSERMEDFYIFKYEASRSDSNLTYQGSSNIPTSQEGVHPWNDISQQEAVEACERLGENYSLPSNKQWQEATGVESGNSETFLSGNTDSGRSFRAPNRSCKLVSSISWGEKYCLTGTGSDSWASSEGVVDMVGNLWEWTSTVKNVSELELSGEYGYVSSWDREDMWPQSVSEERTKDFDSSIFYAPSSGEWVVRRGGYWSSGQDSGAFSMLVDRKPDEERLDTGFRCVYRD